MLPLPIKPSTLLDEVIAPALRPLPAHMTSDKANVLLVATALQESDLNARVQLLNGGGDGPARGLWQFERGSKATRGGVWGVFLHRASHEYLRLVCRARDCSFDPYAIWAQLQHDDVLAAAVARLLIFTDAQPLPAVDDVAGAWALYADRCWRPGKPNPKKWPACHAAARAAVLNLS